MKDKPKLSDIESAFMYVANVAADRRQYLIKIGMDYEADKQFQELNQVLKILNYYSYHQKEGKK